jgi:dTDP-4-dehydrorhamnose reductase
MGTDHWARGHRLLVTGGSGYLGSVLVARARTAGWSVTAASHRQPGLARLDVRDHAAVRALLRAVRPHAVVHTAYVQHGPDAWDVTVEGSGGVAAAARDAGARLVHLSTDVVFDGRAGRPYHEGDPVSPITDYGRAKVEAERRVLAADPGAVVVRTSLLYGGPARSRSAHERAATDPCASFYTDEVRCPVQVDDLAAALLELCELDVAGPLHVAGPVPVSRWQFACLAAGREVAGRQAPPDRPLDCRLDSSRARERLRARLRGVPEVFAPPT